jgi:hypothetical protein
MPVAAWRQRAEHLVFPCHPLNATRANSAQNRAAIRLAHRPGWRYRRGVPT